jgi:hypothetical protein
LLRGVPVICFFHEHISEHAMEEWTSYKQLDRLSPYLLKIHMHVVAGTLLYSEFVHASCHGSSVSSPYNHYHASRITGLCGLHYINRDDV